MKMLMFAAMLVVAVSAGRTAPVQSAPMQFQPVLQNIRQDMSHLMNMVRMPKDQVRGWTTALFECLANKDINSALLLVNDHTVWRDVDSWTNPAREVARGTAQIRECLMRIFRSARNCNLNWKILACDEARMTSIVKATCTYFWVPTNRTVSVDICMVLKWATSGHLESWTASPLNWQSWLEQTSTPAMKRLMNIWMQSFAHGHNPLDLSAGSPVLNLVAPDIKVHINMSPNPLGKSLWRGTEELRTALNDIHRNVPIKLWPLLSKLAHAEVITADNDNVVCRWEIKMGRLRVPMVLAHYRFDHKGLLCEMNLEGLRQIMPWQTWTPTKAMLENESTETPTLGHLMEQNLKP